MLIRLNDKLDPYIFHLIVDFGRIGVLPTYPPRLNEEDEWPEVEHHHAKSHLVNWHRVVIYSGTSIGELEKMVAELEEGICPIEFKMQELPK